MQCELCGEGHYGNYGSGRFCSRTCARKFSTKEKRSEINKKVSEKLKKSPLSPKRTEESRRLAALKLSKTCLDRLMTRDTATLSHALARIRVIVEQNYKCADCTLDSWMGQPLTLELEHKNGVNTDNERDNLKALCPNCHSLTPTWRGRNNKVSQRQAIFIRLQEIKNMGL